MEMLSSNLQIENPTVDVWRKIKSDLIEILDTDDVIQHDFYIYSGDKLGEHPEVCWEVYKVNPLQLFWVNCTLKHLFWKHFRIFTLYTFIIWNFTSHLPKLECLIELKCGMCYWIALVLYVLKFVIKWFVS